MEHEKYSWDLSETDEIKKLRWALSQWRLLALHNMKGKNLSQTLPELGSDEQGSSTGFDWWMVLQSETQKLLAGPADAKETT